MGWQCAHKQTFDHDAIMEAAVNHGCFLLHVFQVNAMLSVFQARSSVVEHHLDMVVVGGSIPLVPTKLHQASWGMGGRRIMGRFRWQQ
jgi:hypothetical protein